MIHLHRRIENQLNRASTSWRWVRFLKHSAILASLMTLLVLALGIAMRLEWLTSSTILAVSFVLLVLAGGFVWMILGIMSIGASTKRNEMAQAVEHSNQSLMDRINTLIFLEGRTDESSSVIADCITKQTRDVLSRQPGTAPYSVSRSLPHFLTLFGLLVGTGWFYLAFQPWRQVGAAKPVVQNEQVAPPLDIPNQETTNQIKPPEDAPWAEIRISEPGRDLQATRLDVVQIQIEAAANRSIQRVEWVSAVNNNAELRHALPAPEDPRYAVYRPVINVEEFGLGDWDVVSYFARANCEDGTTYVSDIYFIEVIPFREELEKLPGGSKGTAFELLSRLTGMIRHQQELIRQTFREENSSNDSTEKSAADKKKHLDVLAKHEASLAESARHMAARLKSELDEKAIEGVTDQLQKTAESLEVSTTTLQGNDPATARRHETAALANLITTRKQAHQLARDNAEAFQNPDELADDDTLELVKKKKEQIETLQKKAGEFDKLAKQQRDLARQAAETQDAEQLRKLADQQQQLLETVERLIKDFPEDTHAAEGLQREGQEVQQSIQRALEVLEGELTDPAQFGKMQKALARAAEKMARLAEKMHRKAEEMQLAESMRLKRQLKKNIEEYADVEKQPEQKSNEELKQTAERTKDVLNELEQLTKQETTKQKQRSELSKALEKKPREQLEEQTQKLAKENRDSQKKKLAGEIKKDLEELSKALDADLERKRSELENIRLKEEMKLMEESQRHGQDARKFIQDALLKQRDIERDWQRTARMKTLKRNQELAKLSKRQQELQKSVEDFIQDNPEPFRDVESETEAVKNALKQAARSFNRREGNSGRMANNAADALQQLDSALEEQQQLDKLTDSYRMKKMLEEQISQLKRIEQKPDGTSQQQAKQAAERSKALTDQLKKLGENNNGQGKGKLGDALGESMKKALTDQMKQQIDSQAQDLSDAKDAKQRGQSAGELRKSLEELAKAFKQGDPDGFERPGQGPLAKRGLAQGIRQAESLARRMQQGRNSEQLRREALRNLADALKGDYGNNESAQKIVDELGKMQEPLFTFDAETIRELIRKIQSLRREVAAKDESKTEQAELRNLDPTKLPPDYRKSIEKYFEKLSESKK